MQTIPYSGLMIRPGSETDGYDEQKDMIERGARKIHALYAKNGRQDITVVRAIPTEEKGTLFTVFIAGGRWEFGLYSDGAIRQEMDYGHPPIRTQHLDRLCSRVENDLQGNLRYKDNPDIEKAWHICLDTKFEKAVAGITGNAARQEI